MRQRRNLLFGLVAVSLAAILLLFAFDVLPEGVRDILTRSWSVVLVVMGLGLMLRNRVPASGFIAIVISALLVGGVTYYAYTTRTAQVRADYQVQLDERVGDGIGLLQVTVEVLTTEVEIALAAENRTISGDFSGSRQSEVQVEYVEDNAGLAVMTVRERKPEAFPSLDDVGRGRLRLNLPANVPLDVLLTSVDGDMTLNMSGMALERLNITNTRGDALVTLPEYAPVSESARAEPGALIVQNGDLTLFLPFDLAARLRLEGASGIPPEYDDTLYDNISNVLLERRGYADATMRIEVKLIVSRGRIAVETAPE